MSSCEKVPFTSRKAAMRQLAKRSGSRVRTYWCNECKAFHISTKFTNQRKHRLEQSRR